MAVAAESPQVIAVLGVKGGVGTTLVTVGLAGELAETREPCVVDLDLYKGDVAGLLDLETRRPLVTVVDLLPDLDRAGLRACAVVHRSGVAVVGQPEALAEAGAPSPAEVRAFLALAREAWSPVLVDCGSRVDPQTVQASLYADAVLLVSTLDLMSLRDLNRVATLLIGQGVPRDRLRIVLNKVDRDPDVALDDVRLLTAIPVAATVRRDTPAARAATHDGEPPHETAPNSRLASDLVAAWAGISGEHLEPPAGTRWWQRVFHRAPAPLPS